MATVRVKTVTFKNDGYLEMEIEKFMDLYENHRLVSVSIVSMPYFHKEGRAVAILEKVDV